MANSNPGAGEGGSMMSSSGSGSGDGPPQQQPDRIAQIMEYLDDPTLDTLPDHLRMKYTDGFDPDKLEEQLQSHPFFMTEFPDPSKPLPPLLDAFQQLKYSEAENTDHELALNHKEDGLFHFKLKKYRIAATCYTTAISYELKYGDQMDTELLANLYNNRSACSFFIGNFRSCLKDCEDGLKYKPSYQKILRRAVLSAEKLEKWSEVERYCKLGEETCDKGDADTIKFYLGKRGDARRGKAKLEVQKRRRGQQDDKKEQEKKKILEMVKERGIQVGNWDFLEGTAAQEGRHVTISEENTQELNWPVLFMYPQYQESDFIEAFNEKDNFSAHLYEMLDKDRPGWDVGNEYHMNTAEVYYLGQKFVKIDPNSSLINIMKEEWYHLPSTGVPTFLILCGNEFSADFLERVDVLG